MKGLLTGIIAVIFVFALILTPQVVMAGAYDDATGTASDTAYFDGGSGSTINTSASTESSVPDVGPSGPVGYYDQDGEYHSY